MLDPPPALLGQREVGDVVRQEGHARHARRGAYGAAMTSSTIPTSSTIAASTARTGFVATLGPARAVRRPARRCGWTPGPELHNHLGGPHAAAIFGLGETTAFVVLLRVFGDLVGRRAPCRW